MDKLILLITMIVAWILGFISKKMNIKTDLIPYQNLLIGLLVAIVHWTINKDFSTAIMVSGLLAGGIYDIFHNISKMAWYQKYALK